MSTTPNQNKACAIIPFYNEQENISKIISKTLPFVNTIILVDDGSTDSSSSLIKVDERIILLKHKKNLGKGAALKTGFYESLKRNFLLTLTLDADLQHPPEEIPAFISGLKKYDMVIGNRMSRINDMPLQRIASNKITSLLLSMKTKRKLPDTQCGFRGFRNEALKNILPKASGYESESEIIINAARMNYSIGFINIPTIYSNQKSKMKPLQAITGFIKVLFI